MNVLIDNKDLFLEGFKNTLILFFASGALALVLGIIVGVMRVSPVPALRFFGMAYVNLVRNTPLTLILFFFAFGYPRLGLPELNYMSLAILGLSFYTATYVAEAIRSGVNTVPVGQAEAARSLGLTFGQSMTQVIMPQAVRSVVPPLMSVLIALLKNTTVAAGFSVVNAGSIMGAANERGEPTLIVALWVALFFIVIVLALGQLQRYLEKKWRIAR